ncbi:Gfo/Idh/MocA family oxidoreductase [candidate division KSB1 bacterium]|nr:Gfo/Idh/MocA family oxidoreductase [candidate division KSB1 bacterium]
MSTKSKKTKEEITRRDFIKTSAKVGGAAMLAGNGIGYVWGSDKIRVGLIGCGGRGTGAGIIDCAESSKGIELVAMGDIFQDHIDEAPEQIKQNLEKRGLSFKNIYKVTPETTFVGFDAYKKVLDCDVDMVILTTPPNFRPEHIRAAVEAGKHIFMEKPIAVDPVSVRSVIKSSEKAKEKGLTMVAGTQLRRLESYAETIKRIHDGAIGEIVGGQVVRCSGGMRNWRENERLRSSVRTDMEYHIRRWLFWTWLSGDFIVEMHVHNLDIMNWILGSHPVQCMGMGGRQARTGLEYGNVYDHFSVEYLYPNDVRIEYMGAQIDGFTYRNDQRVSGTKGSAYVHAGDGIIKGENPYQYEGNPPKPTVVEYADMIESIRLGKAINEGRQIAESTMTAIIGRMSAYTGRALKWDWAMKASKLDLSPEKMEFGDLPERPVAIPGILDLI